MNGAHEWIKILGSWIWGWSLLGLLAGTGLYRTIRLRGLQFRALGRSLCTALIIRREEGASGDIFYFHALMTALAAAVATAIAVGGPGALF